MLEQLLFFGQFSTAVPSVLNIQITNSFDYFITRRKGCYSKHLHYTLEIFSYLLKTVDSYLILITGKWIFSIKKIFKFYFPKIKEKTGKMRVKRKPLSLWCNYGVTIITYQSWPKFTNVFLFLHFSHFFLVHSALCV